MCFWEKDYRIYDWIKKNQVRPNTRENSPSSENNGTLMLAIVLPEHLGSFNKDPRCSGCTIMLFLEPGSIIQNNFFYQLIKSLLWWKKSAKWYWTLPAHSYSNFIHGQPSLSSSRSSILITEISQVLFFCYLCFFFIRSTQKLTGMRITKKDERTANAGF